MDVYSGSDGDGDGDGDDKDVCDKIEIHVESNFFLQQIP